MKKRNRKTGQSMVEYALGIGCVAALCVVALGSLGDMCGDMIHNVELAINYQGPKSSDFTPTIKRTAQPWNLQ